MLLKINEIKVGTQSFAKKRKEPLRKNVHIKNNNFLCGSLRHNSLDIHSLASKQR